MGDRSSRTLVLSLLCYIGHKAPRYLLFSVQDAKFLLGVKVNDYSKVADMIAKNKVEVNAVDKVLIF